MRRGAHIIQQNNQKKPGLGEYPNMYSTSFINLRAPVKTIKGR